ncbi:MAG: hypothetical protein R3F62_15280 [Planctomycetota bacterium]
MLRTLSAPMWIGERRWSRHSLTTETNSLARRSHSPSIRLARAFLPPGSSSSLATCSARSRSWAWVTVMGFCLSSSIRLRIRLADDSPPP